MSFKKLNFNGSKIEIKSKYKLTKDSLPIIYTPGVAKVSLAIAKNKKKVYEFTFKKNSVAVISDGSAVLGLGNIGPEAALPVMEGKAVIFKELGGVDAVPIVLATQDIEEIIKTVKAISPTFGGINLEDISAPRCFEIEQRLIKEMDIPVFHDDQHGTAIVVLAGLINALKVVRKNPKNIKVIVSGAGAAGIAISKLLMRYDIKNIIIFDTRGAIYAGRKEGMNNVKIEIAEKTNKNKFRGSMKEALTGSDVFIGVSAPNLLIAKDISVMNKKAVVFAMSNPVPEISYAEAKKGGAAVVATGRSDFPNQVNNALVFPGIFRGVLDARVRFISDFQKVAVAKTIAGLVKKPQSDKIIPEVLDGRVARAVADVFISGK